MGKEKRIGQGGALVGERDGSGVGRVGLDVVCRVSSGVVRWGRSYVVLPFCVCPLPDRRRKPGGCSVGVPWGTEEERRIEKTSLGKGHEECFAGEKIRRTSGLTRT